MGQHFKDPIRLIEPVQPLTRATENPLELPVGQFVLGISVVLNVLLAALLVFSWTASGDVSNLRQELSGVADFEDRISRNVSQMNAAIQGRLDDVQTDVTEMEADLKNLQATFDRLIQEAQAVAEISPSLTRFSEGSGAVSKGVDGSVSSVMPQFRRIVQEDGKIRFERMR